MYKFVIVSAGLNDSNIKNSSLGTKTLLSSYFAEFIKNSSLDFQADIRGKTDTESQSKSVMSFADSNVSLRYTYNNEKSKFLKNIILKKDVKGKISLGLRIWNIISYNNNSGMLFSHGFRPHDINNFLAEYINRKSILLGLIIPIDFRKTEIRLGFGDDDFDLFQKNFNALSHLAISIAQQISSYYQSFFSFTFYRNIKDKNNSYIGNIVLAEYIIFNFSFNIDKKWKGYYYMLCLGILNIINLWLESNILTRILILSNIYFILEYQEAFKLSLLFYLFSQVMIKIIWDKVLSICIFISNRQSIKFSQIESSIKNSFMAS
jgi:hypothetical protein